MPKTFHAPRSASFVRAQFSSVTLLLSGVVLAGCGNNENSNSSSNATSAIAGNWEFGCKLDSDGTWTKVSNTYSDATHFSIETNAYSDDACTKIKLNVHFEGSYALSGENFDFTVENANVTASAAEELATWKLTCSDLTWELGKKNEFEVL